MEPRELLDMAADAIIRCKDGVDIPVSLFCIISSCSVLREMVRECGGSPMDAEGRRVLEVFLDSDTVGALIDAIHSRDMSTPLSPEACQAAMVGAKALGASQEERIILDNMLNYAHLNRHDPGCLEMFMHHLLDSNRTRAPAARLVAKAFPRFDDAADMLKRVAEKSHGFSHGQVVDLVPILCRKFVPCSIFILLMGLVPPETLDAHKVGNSSIRLPLLAVAGSWKPTPHFHPHPSYPDTRCCRFWGARRPCTWAPTSTPRRWPPPSSSPRPFSRPTATTRSSRAR